MTTFQLLECDLSLYSGPGSVVGLFMINFVCVQLLNSGHLQIEMLPWATGNHQLAESHVLLWTSPSTWKGQMSGWAGRCKAGHRLLFSYWHESRCNQNVGVTFICCSHFIFFLNQIPFNPEIA